MKILSGLSHLTNKSESRTRLLLHGKLLHTFNNEWSVSAISETSLKEILQSASRPVLFLASPYIYSFVHETIPLSRAEMEKADRQLLGFSEPPSPSIKITSLKLNDQKAVTIHSHLTKTGAELLKSLQKGRIGFSWHPAVSSMIFNIHRHPEQLAGERRRHRLFLADEMLQVEKQSGIFRFQHLHYLNQDLDYENKRRTMEQILEKTDGPQNCSALVFSNQAPLETGDTEFAPNSLLLIPPRGRHFRSVTLIQKKRRLAFRSFIKRNHLLGLAAFIIGVWAILINMHAFNVNKQQIDRAKSVARLQQQSVRLHKIAELKRKHARFTAIRKAASSLKIQPALYMKGLDRTLPKGIWVKRISIQYNQIALELLDSGETELSALMDQMGRRFGKTSLKANETVKLEKIPIRKYTMAITQLKPWKRYENLAK